VILVPSAITIAPKPDGIHAHEFASVVHFIENAVFADANPPVVDSSS
jgi:hypothetical protein